MPQTGITASLSRRGLLAAGGALGAGAVLTACGGNSDSATSSASGGGSWTFTDDRKKKLTAKSAPKRIVAFTGVAAALVDFGIDDQIVGVFGETELANGKADPQAGDLDISKVTILGNVWGEFNIEKYAALDPDLLVTHQYESSSLWYVPTESEKKILALAPSAAITVARVPLTTPIQRYAELAESLGADLKAAKVTEAKARFEKAAATLRSAAKASGGIKVLAASASADIFYASNPGVGADLMYFKSLGVDIIVPNKLDKGDYFESLSWENADKYDADLIILDNRASTLQPKDLTSRAAWKALPAVKAGQVAEWDAVPRFSYAGAAPLLENLAAAIAKSKKLS
jgi:iron complex transport system substrate-binding protein